MHWTDRRERYRAVIAGNECIHPGSVFDAISARIAEELGKRMVLNSVMVGFFTAITNLLDPGAVRQAIAASVPPNFKELNLKAFERGLEYGTAALTATPNAADITADVELETQYSRE